MQSDLRWDRPETAKEAAFRDQEGQPHVGRSVHIWGITIGWCWMGGRDWDAWIDDSYGQGEAWLYLGRLRLFAMW